MDYIYELSHQSGIELQLYCCNIVNLLYFITNFSLVISISMRQRRFYEFWVALITQPGGDLRIHQNSSRSMQLQSGIYLFSRLVFQLIIFLKIYSEYWFSSLNGQKIQAIFNQQYPDYIDQSYHFTGKPANVNKLSKIKKISLIKSMHIQSM